MRFFIFLCIALLCFQTYGEKEPFYSEFSSTYKKLPKNIETANLRWKIGFIFYSNGSSEKKPTIYQIPLLAELKMPFSIQNPHIKWLIQMGPGWMKNLSYHKVCNSAFIPNPPEPPFDSDFFQESYEESLEKTTNEKTCRKKRTLRNNWSFPYFFLQPGLSYNFGSLTGLLKGGIFFGGPKTAGTSASLSIGSDSWDIGIQALYYDRLYFGIAFTAGTTLKKWQVKNPYKTDSRNID